MPPVSESNNPEEQKLREEIKRELHARLQAGHIVHQAEQIVKNAIQQAHSDLSLAKNIFDFSNDAILTQSLNGTITSWNPGAEKMFGYRADEILFKPIDTIVPDDKKAEWNALFKQVESGASIPSLETVGLCRDGTRLDLSTNLFPIRDADRVMGAGMVARDITEMKRAVLLKERLAAMEYANRELEAFSFAVAHDLRSPLLAVKNIVDWLREDLQGRLTGESTRHMELLLHRVDRMDRLLAGLLNYARIGQREALVETVSIRTLIDDAVHLVDPPPGFTVQVAASVDTLPSIETAPAALGQIFQNLIGNAIKHHDRTEGTVQIAGRELDDTRLEFAVSDDGPGIPTQFHNKVFELFQTLRPKGSNGHNDVGVGLALVKKQIYATGGTITIESNDARGTTFRFTWPRTWPTRKT